MRPFRYLLFVIVGLLPKQLLAAASLWHTNPHGQVRLISPYMTAPEVGTAYFGLQFKTTPGWHVYWKYAGDAGYPPKVTWEGSRGFKIKSTLMLWPLPHRYDLPGDIKAYGYTDEVVYPIQVTLDALGVPLHAVAHVSYLTCNESCVPYKYELTLDIPTGPVPSNDPEASDLLERFRAQVPANDPDPSGIPAALPVSASGHRSFIFVLLLSFLGGLILNVMPCVLPVLSIKLFGLLQHGGQDRRIIVRDALASAAGIVFSFLLGGVLILVAKATGKAVGWGVQFQDPRFIFFLMVLVSVFALNMWGVFEINLPSGLSRLGAMGPEDEGAASFFLSGMFATLLATPCSAPFLGTAMGFALSQQAPVILAIFLSAGIGMAVPYWALAVFPAALRWLPKPGAWMSHLKIFLGCLLAGTALWLGWVFVHQVGWVQQASQSSGVIQWIPFEEDKIQPLVESGHTVFVDVTAEWCITCQVNEKLVLHDSDIAAEFKRRDVVMMRADWTNQDAAIGRYLKRYGRAGIPFYALYAPRRPPLLLSEFLTKQKVLRALQTLDSPR